MNGKRHRPEQIIHKLRQAEVELGQGPSRIPVVSRLTASTHLPAGHSSILHEAATTIHDTSRILSPKSAPIRRCHGRLTHADGINHTPDTEQEDRNGAHEREDTRYSKTKEVAQERRDRVSGQDRRKRR